MKTTTELRQRTALMLLHEVYPEGATLIVCNKDKAQKSGVMFRALAPGISLDQSGPFSYVVINLKRRMFYHGISWAMAPGGSRDGITFETDAYTGSPNYSSYRTMLDRQSPHDFLLIVTEVFDTPDGYADMDCKGQRSVLEKTLGESEKYAIKRSRDLFGQYGKGGRTLNIGGGGLNGSFIPGGMSAESNPNYGKKGSDHHCSIPVIELVSGKVYGGVGEAQRQTGVCNQTIVKQAKSNKAKIVDGEMLLVPNITGSSATGTCWVYLSDFQCVVASGKSVQCISFARRDEAVVRMRDAGMKWTAIAKAVNCPPSTLEGMYTRGRWMMGIPVDSPSGPRVELDRRNKKILYLRDIENKTFTEIGNALGITRSTAWSAYCSIKKAIGDPHNPTLNRKVRDRKIFDLRTNGMTFVEIGKTMGIDSGTASDAYHRTKNMATNAN